MPPRRRQGRVLAKPRRAGSGARVRIRFDASAVTEGDGQFQALRDGDRFFYLNDPVLDTIQTTYGITYRHSLAELINLDTGETVPSNVFKAG